jgi:hypothetical protein
MAAKAAAMAKRDAEEKGEFTEAVIALVNEEAKKTEKRVDERKAALERARLASEKATKAVEEIQRKKCVSGAKGGELLVLGKRKF